MNPRAADTGDDPVAEAVRRLRDVILAGETYRAATAASAGITLSDSMAVSYLNLVGGPVGQTALARHLRLTPSATTSVVDRLNAPDWRNGRRTRPTGDVPTSS